MVERKLVMKRSQFVQMRNKKPSIIFVGQIKTLPLVLILMLLSFNNVEAITTINPDIYSNGTDISTVFSGVTLLSIGDAIGLDGKVYARTPINSNYASTQANVFGSAVSGTDPAGSPQNEIWQFGADVNPTWQLKAIFDGLIDYVAIDFIGNDYYEFGILEAYDSSGNLLDSASNPVAIGQYEIYTAEISRSLPDIKYIIASGGNGDTIYLDNLIISEPIPAPGAILLGGIGVGIIGWLRRRRAI